MSLVTVKTQSPTLTAAEPSRVASWVGGFLGLGLALGCGGAGGTARAVPLSEGSCSPSPSPPPIGPTLTVPNNTTTTAWGGFAVQGASSTTGGPAWGGLLCGWPLGGSRYCVQASSEEEDTDGFRLVLNLYLETTLLQDLASANPSMRIVVEEAQSHPWRNAMKLANLSGPSTEEGCPALVFGVQTQGDNTERLTLFVLPGVCEGPSLTANTLTADTLTAVADCPLNPLDETEVYTNSPDSSDSVLLTEVLSACGGTRLEIPQERSSDNATEGWDVLTLDGQGTQKVATPMVVASAQLCTDCAEGVGLFDLKSAAPAQPRLWLTGKGENPLLKALARAIPQGSAGARGLLIASAGSSSTVSFVPAATLEEALASTATPYPSLDLSTCTGCVSTTPAANDKIEQLIISATESASSTVLYAFISTDKTGNTQSKMLQWGRISWEGSAATPTLSIKDLALTGGTDTNDGAALAPTSMDVDGDGLAELWFSPTSLLSKAMGGTSWPGVGLLLSGALDPKSSDMPQPGLVLAVQGKGAPPLLLGSGTLQVDTTGEGASETPLPYELIGWEDSALTLWTGLDRLFDRDGDGFISAPVPIRTSPWSSSQTEQEETLHPAGDCNDTNSSAAPGMLEQCSTDEDEDCRGNGRVGCDADGDGFGTCIDCDDSIPGDTLLLAPEGTQPEALWCESSSCTLGGRPSGSGGFFVGLMLGLGALAMGLATRRRAGSR